MNRSREEAPHQHLHVRTHIANIYKKFEVNNKVDLLMHLQPILKDQTTPP